MVGGECMRMESDIRGWVTNYSPPFVADSGLFGTVIWHSMTTNFEDPHLFRCKNEYFFIHLSVLNNCMTPRALVMWFCFCSLWVSPWDKNRSCRCLNSWGKYIDKLTHSHDTTYVCFKFTTLPLLTSPYFENFFKMFTENSLQTPQVTFANLRPPVHSAHFSNKLINQQ